MCTACEWAPHFAVFGRRASLTRRTLLRAAAVTSLAAAAAACATEPGVGSRQLIGDPGAQVLAPADQALTVEEAVHANTMGAAYQIRLDEKVGSIEAGKLADLIVLDCNIFDIDPHDIHAAAVTMTMMNGQIHHEA